MHKDSGENITRRPQEKPFSFPEEQVHLAQTLEWLEEAFAEAGENADRLEQEYREAKRYMADNRGEIDPHEMFQNELLLKQTDRTGAFAAGVRDRIARLKESPYFARIDFREDGSPGDETYYIGRFGFQYKKKPLIYDWRAPVSGMFYDYENGPASFEAPAGRITGQLTRKRQFKITGGVMEYALESSLNVQDDVLQKELSAASDEKMKSIIATIQKEQNRIIRNEKAETLIIQGVAGSGKTSIALHRIAFLLYRFQKELSSRNVTILSPNRVFGDYIANVIPELGEEPIFALGFAELAQLQLEGVIGFVPESDPFDTQDEKFRERVRYKSTLEFVRLLEEYRRQLPYTVFIPEDYRWGRFLVEKEWIRKRFLAYGKFPVKKRLALVAGDIRERMQTENIRGEELPRAKAIEKSLMHMLTMKDSLTLYRDFYEKMGIAGLFVMPATRTLEWADVYPFLYLRAAFEGLKESGVTKHLVIDEMQDYTPVQYAVLNEMFRCPKTILGDFGQRLNPDHLHTLKDIRRIYKGAEFVMLNKSYRSTYEIISFARRICPNNLLEAMERHGKEPQVFACADRQAQIERIREAVQGFEERREKGRSASMGIILKTDRDAKAMYDALAGQCRATLISPESTGFSNGVSITSVRMAKGLEFDEVVVADADKNTYGAAYDRGLLYVACTRAMHMLTVMGVGELTRELEEIGEPAEI